MFGMPGVRSFNSFLEFSLFIDIKMRLLNLGLTIIALRQVLIRCTVEKLRLTLFN